MLSEFLILCRAGFLYLLIYVRCEVKNKVFYLYLPGSKMNRSDVLVGKTSFMLSVRLLVGIRLLRIQLRLLNQEEARGAALGFIQTHWIPEKRPFENIEAPCAWRMWYLNFIYGNKAGNGAWLTDTCSAAWAAAWPIRWGAALGVPWGLAATRAAPCTAPDIILFALCLYNLLSALQRQNTFSMSPAVL